MQPSERLEKESQHCSVSLVEKLRKDAEGKWWLYQALEFFIDAR